MTAREHVRWWLIGVVAAGAVIYLLRDMLLPFVAGAAVAYLLDPLADKLQRGGRMSRTLAVTLITLGFVLLVIAATLLIVPTVYRQFVAFAERLPGYIDKGRELLEPYIADVLGHVPAIEFQQVKEALGVAGSMAAAAATFLGKVLAGGMVVLDVLSLLFITPIVTFYLLRDWDTIVGKIDELLPRQQAPMIRRLAREIDDALAAFVRGQVMVCLVMAIYYATVLSLIGLDFGLLVGAVSGLITFIPFVGALVAFLLSMGIGLVQFLPNPWPLAGILGMYVFAQVAEGNVLTPKLVGDKVGLHPVWVIFAMLAGGSLFGFVGVLLALPAAAAAGVLVRYTLERYRESKLYYGPDG
jgi:predicted PurR-regulated permease PerM